jgi:hypothetical protein
MSRCSYTAKKAHGIIICHGSVSMYREDNPLYGKGAKISCIYGNDVVISISFVTIIF